MQAPPAVDNPFAGNPRYQYIRPLGSGSFGSVHEAVDLQRGIIVAIKLLPRSQLQDAITRRDVKREVINHRLLQHPHIIFQYDVFILPEYLAISMECATGGTLYHYVITRQYEDGVKKRLKEDEARWYFQQVILALTYLHEVAEVSNRDLKLENCLLMASTRRPYRRVLKLCDFGYSKNNKDSMAKTLVGTIGYMAPEVLAAADGPRAYDGFKADLWSCGVLLYTLLVGRYPFSRPADYAKSANPIVVNRQTMERIRSADYIIPPEYGLSDGVQHLIAQLLTVEPLQRATLADVKKDAWFDVDIPPGALDIIKQCPKPQWDSEQIKHYEKIIDSL